MLNKKKYRDMLDDVCSDSCRKDKKCILKDFLVSSHPTPRVLVQIKCIDRFKIILAKERNTPEENVSWEESLQEWVDRGHAKKFSDVYQEGVQYRTIFNKVLKGS